uniref:BED-type domain-containing protein n=1 Tax=Ananas comosus var. bracteatus TaxID=296719 RepID=A0A6V7PLH1_ANACO|nr:unnamed protein product [Ananas comosus var. bracteatus]
MSKKAQDPGWEHAYPPIEKDRTRVKCKYCQNEYNGGISRFKRHLAGIIGMLLLEHKEEALKQLRGEVNITDMEDYSDYETGEILSKRSCVGSSKSTQKGLIDRFCIPTPKEALRRGKDVQPTINEKLKEKERERTIEYIARWFYEAGIPFNAASLESFSLMLEAIGQYGRGLKAPTPYELRVPLLKKEVEETKAFLKTHRDCWEANGCSIMTDTWTDKRGRNLMNLVVNCELGTSFLRSIESSSEVHDGPFIFKLVSSCIDEIGEENVVQVISDNASANMAAANLLRAEPTDDDEKKYRPVWNIIDSRFNDKLKTPLPKAGYFLNPFFYYARKDEIDSNASIMDGVLECLLKFYPNDPSKQDKILEELPLYKTASGSFGREIAIRQDKSLILIQVIIVVWIILNCSNKLQYYFWFQIHTKKRNRLEQKRLNDLVFVKFNARLRLRQADRNRDPIALNDRDEDEVSESEWKAPTSIRASNVTPQNEEVFPGEGLTWGQVGKATGATSQARRNARRKATTQTQRAKTRTIDDVEFELSESEGDEETNVKVLVSFASAQMQ